MDEKMIETTLENLIGRINDIKISLHNYLGKLQHEHLSWPQVLDNFALLSGQINTLNKLLSNERMPALRNLCILPIKVSMDKDDELESFSEHRMMVFNHEVVPNALRTKYEPQVEHEEQRLALEVSSMNADQAESAVSSLNELVTSVLDLVQSARDDWEGESAVEQTDLLPSANDTNILIAAIQQGTALRKRPEYSRGSGGGSNSSRSKNYNQTNNRATAAVR